VLLVVRCCTRNTLATFRAGSEVGISPDLELIARRAAFPVEGHPRLEAASDLAGLAAGSKIDLRTRGTDNGLEGLRVTIRSTSLPGSYQNALSL